MNQDDGMKIAVFASGGGTNAEAIFAYFAERSGAGVSRLLTNNPKAGAIRRAQNYGVPTTVFDKRAFAHTNEVTDLLRQDGVGLVVLAGFLWQVPPPMVRAFPNRIVNIHPALLPKYGGKGMYGMHVHRAVKAAGEKETGITIHYVNEAYDEGQVIKQARCPVAPGDTPEDIAQKVQKLEHAHYPAVVYALARNSFNFS